MARTKSKPADNSDPYEMTLRAGTMPSTTDVMVWLRCGNIIAHNAVVDPNRDADDKSPTVVISREAAQHLFNDLWAMGFRSFYETCADEITVACSPLCCDAESLGIPGPLQRVNADDRSGKQVVPEDICTGELEAQNSCAGDFVSFSVVADDYVDDP